MAESSPDRQKTLWEKGEIAYYVFSKHLYWRRVKTRIYLGKGYLLLHNPNLFQRVNKGQAVCSFSRKVTLFRYFFFQVNH